MTLKSELLLNKVQVAMFMKDAVERSVDWLYLRNLLHRFIESKQTFPFAELCYLHANVFNSENDEEELYKLMAAVELLVLAFDMFDDLEDLDNFTEPWMDIDRGEAINSSSFLYTLTLSHIHSLSSPYRSEILGLFLEYALQAMKGQHIDLANALKTEKECLQMMRWKSGSLTALAAEAGVMFACGKRYEEVKEYGHQVGIAGQIENDYKGLFTPHKQDRKFLKPSLALLYLQRKFNQTSVDILQYVHSGKDFDEYFGSIVAFKEKLLEAGVTQYLNVMKHIALKKAETYIKKLPLPAEKLDELLTNLIKK
ncbi:MAG: isoprenyl transferase [Bacillaceae bacterium]|nr:MAG: isoprenyl transferase [Bacillaceae bacterium]